MVEFTCQNMIQRPDKESSIRTHFNWNKYNKWTYALDAIPGTSKRQAKNPYDSASTQSQLVTYRLPDISVPGEIVMESHASQLGTRNRLIKVYLQVGTEFPVITFTGIAGCGSFSGPAKINYERSYIGSGRAPQDYLTEPLTEERMSTLLNLRTTAPPPTPEPKQAKRRIYW